MKALFDSKIVLKNSFYNSKNINLELIKKILMSFKFNVFYVKKKFENQM